MRKKQLSRDERLEEKQDIERGVLKDKLAEVLHSQIARACYSHGVPEPGMLVVEIQYIGGIERLPQKSVIRLYDSRPDLLPSAVSQEFASAEYEGPVHDNGTTRYAFRISPGSRILVMLDRKTYRTYDSEKTELVLPTGRPKSEEPCRPPVKRACKEIKFKHQTLDEELSGRHNIELEK